jgi:hypothetical protein
MPFHDAADLDRLIIAATDRRARFTHTLTGHDGERIWTGTYAECEERRLQAVRADRMKRHQALSRFYEDLEAAASYRITGNDEAVRKSFASARQQIVILRAIRKRLAFYRTVRPAARNVPAVTSQPGFDGRAAA